MSVFEIIYTYSPALLGGLAVTVKLFLIVSVVSLFLGALLGVLASKYIPRLGILIKVFYFFLSGIPLIVLIYWFYYPFQTILEIELSPFVTSFIILVLVDMFSVAELIRETLFEFPKQYIVVAQMSGLTRWEIFYKIEFPMILRQILPSLIYGRVFILQATLLTSLISTPETFRIAQNINAIIYKPIEIYTSLAILFTAILAPINYLAYILKKRTTRDFSET